MWRNYIQAFRSRNAVLSNNLYPILQPNLVACFSTRSTSSSSSPSFTPADIQYAQSWLNNLSRNSLPPDSQFSVSYARSSGPGGQNVNKVSTKATLKLDQKYWNIDAQWMPLVVRHVLFGQGQSSFATVDLENLGNKKTSISSETGEHANCSSNRNAALRQTKFPYTTASGSLLIQSDRTRSRESNLEDCFTKLVQAIQTSVYIPKEVSQATQEKWKTVKSKTNEKRLKGKKMNKDKKEGRRRNFDD